MKTKAIFIKETWKECFNKDGRIATNGNVCNRCAQTYWRAMRLGQATEEELRDHGIYLRSESPARVVLNNIRKEREERELRSDLAVTKAG